MNWYYPYASPCSARASRTPCHTGLGTVGRVPENAGIAAPIPRNCNLCTVHYVSDNQRLLHSCHPPATRAGPRGGRTVASCAVHMIMYVHHHECILRGARRVMLSRRNGRRLSRPDMEVFLLGCAGPRVQGVRRAPPWIRGCAPEIAAGTLRAGGGIVASRSQAPHASGWRAYFTSTHQSPMLGGWEAHSI